jgi:glc operon protein GlcG
MQTAAPASPPEYGTSIALALAKQVMQAAEAEALANHWPMVIAIVDAGGHLQLFQRMDNAQLGSVRIAQAKAETALKFRRPTKIFEDSVAAGGTGWRILAMDGMCPLEGGVPLVQDGKIVGAIGVSGMHSSQDAQVANAGANVLK